MSMRKQVSIQRGSLSYEFDGTIKQAIKMLQELETKFPNAVLSYDSRGYDDNYVVYVDDLRLETDEEFENRIALEKIHEERALEYKKSQYERLKKELGVS